MAVLLVLLFTLGACAKKTGTETGEKWTWSRKVTLVCPWGPGGGADGTLRPLCPLLQEILGVPVELVYIEGSGGANGVNFVRNQPADGYTYALCTQSIILLDLQGSLPFDYRQEMTPVAKLVHSTNFLIASKKIMAGRFNGFQEMAAYAKAHPQELSCGMLSATGQDSVSMQQTLAAALDVSIAEVGRYIKTISYGGGSEMNEALLDGYLALGVTGADEIKSMIDSGDIMPLIAMSQNRSPALPGVPCTGELGIDSFIGSWRGIYARTAVPQAAIDSMAAALKKAWETPAYQDFMRNAGYLDRPGYAGQEETLALMEKEYEIFSAYLASAGIAK
jgi:tripartite-type tricarboxylate transporter receptor subunit TctC